MKILHINCNYITTRLHQTMIEHLEEKTDVDNLVFVPTYDKNRSVINPNNNVIISECFKKNDRFFFFYKQRKIINSLKKCVDIDDEHIDLIHAYTLFSDGNVAYSIYKEKGIPYVVAIRDTDINDFLKLKPFLLPRGIEILRNAKKIYFLSPAYKKKILKKIIHSKFYAEIEKKIVIQPNGIDDFWFQNTSNRRKTLNDKKINIVCVAQIVKRKNIPIVQKSIDLLNDEGWNIHLTIIGKSVDKVLLKHLIKNSNTTYIDAIPKEKLIKYYQDSDIFVLASLTETFGLVYAEAMSQALPVIYTKGQGFDEQFEEGTVGFHVNPLSVKSISEAIKNVYLNYSNQSYNCTLLCKKFQWDSICKKYIDAYREIIE